MDADQPGRPPEVDEHHGDASAPEETRSVVSRRRALVAGAGAGAAAVIAGGLAACGGGDSTKDASTTSGGGDEAGAGSARKPRGGGVTLKINGADHQVDASNNRMLLYALRDEVGLRGPKFGCGESECGACAVLANGRQIRSCVTPASSVVGKEITTLEGLPAAYHGARQAGAGHLHPLQQAWIDEQVPQCGYCQNGMIIQAADLLSRNPHPSDAEIKQAMNGHLCRCGTYNAIVRAIRRAATTMAA